MTFTELIEEIKWEAQLQQDATWDAHLLLLIWDEMIQLATLQTETSLYVLRQEFTSADQDIGTLLITIPPLLKLDRIEYHHTGSGGIEWLLPDRNEVIAPIPISGQARAYELAEGVPPGYTLALIPAYLLQTDKLYISYWAYPEVPLGADTVNPASWIQALKTNCVRRAMILNMSTADKRAEIYAQVLAKAEAVSGMSNKSLEVTEDDSESTKR